MKNIFGVIGANYGDEGKGRVTDIVAAQEIANGHKTIVVLTNGSAQRGHTVMRGGKRHVFKHFGSGMMAGAHNYFPKDFIINPYIYEDESMQLEYKDYIKRTKCYANENCKVALVYDMMANQIIELSRTDKHGSCGCGVWETIKRYESDENLNKTLGEINQMTDLELEEYITNCNSYSRKKARSTVLAEGLSLDVLNEYAQLWIDPHLQMAMIRTIRNFLSEVELVKDSSFLENYDSVIFENGQGLLLDYDVDEKYSTPSRTGLEAIKNVLDDHVNYDGIVPNIYYVSRTYITRHGSADFKERCDKADLNPEMIDETNQPNPYQGSLYYGHIRCNELYSRVSNDANSCSMPIKYGLAITHTDEYPWKDTESLERFSDSLFWMMLD